MQEFLVEVINLRQLPPGRAAFAMHQMEDLAIKNQAPDILSEEYRRAADKADVTLHNEMTWRNSRGKIGNARGQAVLINSKLDQEVGAFYRVCNGQSVGPDSDPSVMAARKLNRSFFNEGLSAVTQIEYESQLGVMSTMLSRIDSDYTNEVAILGLTRRVDRMRTLTRQFRQELRKRDKRPISYDEVQASRSRHHIAMCRAVVITLAELKEDTPANQELVKVLMAPLIDQQERVAEAYRRRRRPLDVDPESGDEVSRPEEDPDISSDEDVVTDERDFEPAAT